MKKIEKTMGSKPWEQNHRLKTMGPKSWIQNDEPKNADVNYSRSFMKSLFYFIWFYYDIYRERESWDENHGFKTMIPKP